MKLWERFIEEWEKFRYALNRPVSEVFSTPQAPIVDPDATPLDIDLKKTVIEKLLQLTLAKEVERDEDGTFNEKIKRCNGVCEIRLEYPNSGFITPNLDALHWLVENGEIKTSSLNSSSLESLRKGFVESSLDTDQGKTTKQIIIRESDIKKEKIISALSVISHTSVLIDRLENTKRTLGGHLKSERPVTLEIDIDGLKKLVFATTLKSEQEEKDSPLQRLFTDKNGEIMKEGIRLNNGTIDMIVNIDNPETIETLSDNVKQMVHDNASRHSIGKLFGLRR